MIETKFAGLDLQGYKTFAKETNLVFPAQITAIVGPNGSGKSNVADAIRWVLGEQSYSLLRAKKTEDMIYSGSDSRARAGMAAVSIKFNNVSKWLPIDYSEVVLTRRAYRDGKNEYLINNQRVRLKDFSELLGRTGLSDRTYTIIGQGLVDTALSIRPDERSKLFEEAAGIGLYQSRKAEALRRLESTERNLERVLDIIAELKPRVRNLEKQAARVSEYKTVQESLKQNLREWYGFHWYKALRETNSIKDQLSSAQLERQAARKTIEIDQVESSSLQEQIEEQRLKVDTLMDHLRELRDQHQSDNQQLAILDERRAAVVRGKLQGQSDLASVEEVIRSGEEKSKSWQLDEDRVRTEFETVLAQLEELKERRSQLLEQEQEYVKADTRLRDALVEVEKEAIVIRSRKQEMSDRAAEIKSAQSNITETLASLGEEEKSLSADNTKLADQIKHAEQQNAGLRQEFKTTRGERSELIKELESHQQSSHSMDLERNRVKNRLELIKQSRESMAGFSDGAKSLLKTSREKKMHEELTDLATHLEVPEKYETAISAALGEAVDVLIVKNQVLGSDLVEGLSARLEDRVAILGQTKQKAAISKVPIGNGMVRASEIVKIEPALQPVVGLLLGDFWVTDSLNEAFAGREKHPQLNFVTIEGEVLLSNGITIIGKANKSSKVSYSRLVKELSSEFDAIEKTREELKSALNQIQKKIELNDGKLRELQSTLDQSARSKEALDREFKATSLSLEKTLSRASWIQRQEKENLTLLQQLENNLAEQTVKERKNNKNREKLLIEQKELKIRRAEFDKGEVENQYHYLETEKQVLSQQLKHLQQTNLSEKSRLENDRVRMNQFQERIAAQETTLAELSRQISALVEKVEADKKHIDEVDENSLQPELSRLRELENQRRVFSETDSANQQTLTEKDRQVVHFQLELAHQQERLENLKTRIDDDFSLIEMEYRNEYRQSSPLPFPDLVIETLPEKTDVPEEVAEAIKQQKTQLRRIGTVNLEADQEYRDVKERYDNLNLQVADLNAALRDIEEMIKELDVVMKKDFLETYKAVSTEFSRMFTRLFNGGSARLMLNDEDSPIDGGIEIEARLPGKREQGLVLLSGGERSLTAVALVFALLKVSPTPFCVLDEVDAMLDESNVGRFIELLKDLSSETQFVLITHNRNTVSAADVIYGVTMGKDSASQVISLRLDEVDEDFIN
jgi:chromosome segregation protein